MSAWALFVAVAVSAAPAPEAGLGDTLAAGWDAVQRGAHAEAEGHYLRATALEPRSEDAWLGLQLARLGRGDFAGAAAAGGQALALNPQSYWAQSRQAWARFNLGEYAAARAHYEAALAQAPEDAEMLLGLGFTLARLGEAEGARARCAEAGRRGADAARVAACEAAVDAAPAAGGAGAVVGLGLTGTWLSDGMGLTDRVYAGALVASVRWPSVTLWAGATVSDTAQTDGGAERLAAGHLGLALRAGAWDAALSGAYLASDLEASDGGGLVAGRVGWQGEAWGLALDAGATLLPSVTAVQLAPRLVWRPAAAWTLSVGPDVVRAGRRLRLSAEARVALAPVVGFGLWASGYAGDRQYPLEAGGLGFWTGDDRFRGGYRVGVDWAPAPDLALHLVWRQDFLTRGEGSGQGATTTLSGLTFGVGTNL